MNDQQLAAVKQALEALEMVAARTGARWALEQGYAGHLEAITALQSIISQDALDKKAENARELGLSYDTPLSSFVRSNDEAKAEVMERVIDKATEEQKAVIGCVNHDCDKCKAVQEPVAYVRVVDGMLGPVRRGKGMAALPDGDYSVYTHLQPAPVQYQRREIGEGDFVNCTKEQYEYAEGSPQMDTRVILTPPAVQPAPVQEWVKPHPQQE